jgi:hypothetical protein
MIFEAAKSDEFSSSFGEIADPALRAVATLTLQTICTQAPLQVRPKHRWTHMDGSE